MNIKNKSTMYVLMRHDFTGNDIPVACTHDYEKADNLQGEYQQQWADSGHTEDEVYFWIAGTVYYER